MSKQEAELVLAVEDAILSHTGWDNAAYSLNSRYDRPFVRTIPGLGVVEALKEGSKVSRTDTPVYADEYAQGSEEDVYILFKLTPEDGSDPRFFKKTGIADSYGEASYSGRFRQVFPTTKTVTVYDFA